MFVGDMDLQEIFGKEDIAAVVTDFTIYFTFRCLYRRVNWRRGERTVVGIFHVLV